MRFSLILFLIFSELTTTLTRANEPVQTWSESSALDYWSTGGLLVGASALRFLQTSSASGWTDGFLFDEKVRNSLRAESRSGRESADHLSDIGMMSLLLAPLVVDAGGLALFRDGDAQTAWRISVISLQSFALSQFLTEAAKIIARRARPFQKNCEAGDPNYDEGCYASDAYRSFFSGHTSIAFTGASLLCLNHEKLSLFRNDVADLALCVGAVGVATTTGYLRIVADRHYTTDVLVGALAGILSGYIVPRSLHHAQDRVSKVEYSRLLLLPTENGLQLTQRWDF